MEKKEKQQKTNKQTKTNNKNKKGMGSPHYLRAYFHIFLPRHCIGRFILVSWGEVFVGPWEHCVLRAEKSEQHFVYFVHSINNLAFDQLVLAAF